MEIVAEFTDRPPVAIYILQPPGQGGFLRGFHRNRQVNTPVDANNKG